MLLEGRGWKFEEVIQTCSGVVALRINRQAQTRLVGAEEYR